MTVGEGELSGTVVPALAYQGLGRIIEDDLLAAAYSAADLFVIPSLYEDLPNTALEAMACGTAVIGFRTGGIVDVVDHGRTGLLASWKDATDLARQIQWLLDHRRERRQMGASARAFMKQEHNLEIQARRFAELYKSATRAAAKTTDLPGGNRGP